MLVIHQPNEEEITVELTSETLFLEIEIDSNDNSIYHQKEITFDNFLQYDSVVVNYFNYKEGDQELTARIVKRILLNNEK